uniref:Uncharacterized protein n=1 Tax=Sciurus vulgaris TaxID=55149 RepID=A0A8D2B796_SCIVU
MGKYMIRVATGNSLLAGSTNLVQLWLVGEHGEADLGKLLWPLRGRKTDLEIDVLLHLGRLLLVKLRKHKSLLNSDWFWKWITVQGPGTQGEVCFPCCSWIQDDGIHCLPEGTGEGSGETETGVTGEARVGVLENPLTPCSSSRWGSCKDGLILPDKDLNFTLSLTKEGVREGRRLRVFYDQSGSHCNEELTVCPQLMSLVRVCDSWKDDDLFGSQFLNGANSMLPRCSTSLPAWLVLPPGMEDLQTQLDKELQVGSLFEQQYVAAPLIMLKLQPDRRLLPMLQPPRHGCPPPLLFLPADPPRAWLLAKTWVHSSDFQVHQLQSHLLRGHLMAGIISVAIMRSLPSLHPIYKLLIPHFRYTMEINILARNNLVSEYGIFDLVWKGGGPCGHSQRATACLTYRSFCPPHDMADRGLLGVKSSLYGQDALRLWDIISRYVQGMVRLFYKSDEAVKHDSELQAWCREITETGLQGAQDRGFPLSLESQAQLCQIVTMCIFTCTGQHASAHFGQLDWYSWIPNGPCTMWKPPSISKDVTEMDIVDSLPDLHQASMQKTFIKFLGRHQPVMVALGQHREKYFSGPGPQAVLKQFHEELAVMDREIKVRNAGLDLPYEYLQPSMVENSVTI